MCWLQYVNAVCKKENTGRSLNFIQWNCDRNVKISACLTIVRPSLEYVACIKDPYQEYLVYNTEKVQRHAAR